MPVPASVIEVLECNNISYQLKASRQRIEFAHYTLKKSQGACLVKSVILTDDQGRVQILLPADHLLDLSAIKSQFGRDLQALEPEDMVQLLQAGSVTGLPAIPEWQGLPTLIDAQLLQHPTLLLDTGDAEQLLEIQQADFQSITKTSVIGVLSAPAPQLPESAAGDSDQIVKSLRTFTHLRIKQRLQDTLELPPLPDSAQRIIQLRTNPNADISDLSNVVELDPSLAAQVVSWASSPYYSAPGKVKSVQDAIVRVLGFDMVMNLSLGLALGRAIDSSAMSPQQVNEYWRQAISTAAAVEGLVTSISREHRPGFGLAYLAGLLNNFGYLVLAEVFPPYFANLNRHCAANPHLSTAVVEQHIIGVSSCQICSWLMESWNMPAEIVVALRQQNNPAYQGEHAVYAKLLYLARQLLANKGMGYGTVHAIPDAVFKDLHINRETAEITIENILSSADDLEAIAASIQG